MTRTLRSRIYPNGPHGLCIYVPAEARDALSIENGTVVDWYLSFDGRTATLTFHTETST